ncbi:MAG TPA: F0F1 ATP synthase subunit delta [Nocardioidaceae bacterium]|nr:F0F1 ATP synthase subunit delta [Nocardioidaceae bacterium]
MRGASAESLATLTEALGQSVDGGADAAQVAEDLFGVSALLGSEPSLRRVVTDPSVAADAKSGLVRSVLGDKVGATALELVAKAAGLRWAATRDLGDALESLGVIALVQGADKAGQADALENELFGFGRLVSENPELRDALSDRSRSVADRRALVRGLLEGKVAPPAVRLAEQAVAGSHRTVAVAVAEYQKVAARHRSRLVGVVRVARELSEQDLARLEAALTRQYSRAVHLNVVVDRAVIGGLKVELGDDVIDGTVSSRLDDARRKLAG